MQDFCFCSKSKPRQKIGRAVEEKKPTYILAIIV